MLFQAMNFFSALDNYDNSHLQTIVPILDFEDTYSMSLSEINNMIYSFLTLTDAKGFSVDTKTFGPTHQQLTLQHSNASSLDALQSIYHYSVPTTKLFYPEPFIAAASFMHSDLWFVHILVYQYWLWFVFIFIIVFFMITFLCIVRWCNMRVRPRRETRGVSRSKCGDLITAIVPVSWAASIIISESTDAVDYFDGFGTTEMIVGIRAYQWGWEYYYPKDIDLNYNVKKNASTFFGHSLKYNKSTEVNMHSNKAWKFYQNKQFDFVVTPAHLLLLGSDNYKILNFLNFSDVGSNVFHESALFRHTRMFSKTFNSNLLFTPNELTFKFKTLSPLFDFDLNLQQSSYYGLKRQQNFLNTKAISNNFSTFFNLKNVEKLFSFNYNVHYTSYQTFEGNYQINFFKPLIKNTLTSAWLFNQTNLNLGLSDTQLSLTKKFMYGTLLNKLNDNNDKKKLRNSLKKLVTSQSLGTKLLSSNILNNNVLFTNNLLTNATPTDQFFLNTRWTKKFFTSFSINRISHKSEQTPKFSSNMSTRTGDFNLTSKLNAPSLYLDKTQTTMDVTSTLLRATTKLKSVEAQTLFKLLTNQLYFQAPTPPFISNKKGNSLLNFDKYFPAEEEVSFIMFQNREELSIDHIYKGYWNVHPKQTNLSWRLNNIVKAQKQHNAFYLPFFTFGQDYDFLNWQGLTYLEDAYWENLASVYTIDDYLNFFDFFADYTTIIKNERVFSRKERKFKPATYSIINPYLQDLCVNEEPSVNFVYSEDTFIAPQLMSTQYFGTFPLSSNLLLLEDSFDYTKSLNHFFSTFYKWNFGALLNNFTPNTTSFVIDNFRSDTEDFNWWDEVKKTSDLTSIFANTKLKFLFTHLSQYTLLSAKSFFKGAKPSYFPHPSITLSIVDPIFLNFFTHTIGNNFEFQKTTRFLSKIELRAPTRALIGSFNSYQKVSKPRFDENRAHARTVDFAQLGSKQPNITAPKSRLERSLGKNKNSFFQISSFRNTTLDNFNNFHDSLNSLNYYFFDLPFLMSLKSDPSRYYWSDWYARWGMFEVQPASSSRYSLSGLPFFNKSFDFSSDVNGLLHDTETYFTRISRARKNYLPSWTHSPFIYVKNTLINANDFFFDAYKIGKKTFNITKYNLKHASFYWTNIQLDKADHSLFNSTNSNIYSFGRSNWTSSQPLAVFYIITSLVLDTLSKREYLYRELLGSKKHIYKLSPFMINNPSSPLLNDIKAVFLLANPTTFNVEYSRESYYNSLEFFNGSILKPEINSLLKTLTHSSKFLENILQPNQKNLNSTPTHSNTLKTQYKPMRRGILNMIRLHGTGAIAMPIEIRLQVLASSKDVIHSWAIPSAGVKIDCVPGYSSHRVLIFLVSGIFWGQCMEVCGRYHHWMPIIVYFMKRDLFFLWCTHFVFASGSNNMWVINDRQFTHYGRTLSFNKASWINELK